MTKNLLIRLIAGVIAVLVLALAIQTSYRVYARSQKKQNHKAVQAFVDDDLTYEQEDLDNDLLQIEAWLENPYLNDEDIGRLYERKSLIHKAKGESAEYARSMGYALYFLEAGADKSYTINLELDLAMLFMTNYAYDLAEQTLNHIYELSAFEAIEDLQIKSYAYRLRAIIECHNEQYDLAEADLLTAADVISQSNTGIYEDAYRGMIAANLAKVYYFQGRYEEAQAILNQYANSELFTQTIYASVLVRDFVIPYYEADIYLRTALNREGLQAIMDTYVAYCEEYDYVVCELNTLLYLAENAPPLEGDNPQGFYALLNNVYKRAASQQNELYTSLLDGEVEDSKFSMKESVEANRARWSRFQRYVMATIFVIMLVVVLVVIVRKNRMDVLTDVYSRRAFDSALKRYGKISGPWAIVMMDIDDFKNVNDKYGHQAGDEVLIRLGQILDGIRSAQVAPYRYGGEEFVLIVREKGVPSVSIIAENIHAAFCRSDFSFDERVTLSMGIATSDSLSEDLLKKADANLYESKRNGKNRVTYK